MRWAGGLSLSIALAACGAEEAAPPARGPGPGFDLFPPGPVDPERPAAGGSLHFPQGGANATRPSVPGGPAIPPGLAFAIQGTGILYSVDLAARLVQPVGAFVDPSGRWTSIADIALDDQGLLLGAEILGAYGAPWTRIWTIDPLSAKLSDPFDVPLINAFALTFRRDGTLVVAGDGVAELDPGAGSVRRMIAAPGILGVGGDMLETSGGRLLVTGAVSAQSLDPRRLNLPEFEFSTVPAEGIIETGGVRLAFTRAGEILELLPDGSSQTFAIAVAISPHQRLCDDTFAQPGWTGAASRP